MKAIVTVVGRDQVGIIAGVCGTLAQHGVNVLEISQTIMEGCFTMMMVVDLAGCRGSFEQLRTDITAYGEARDLSLRIQRETSSTQCTSCKRGAMAEVYITF